MTCLQSTIISAFVTAFADHFHTDSILICQDMFDSVNISSTDKMANVVAPEDLGSALRHRRSDRSTLVLCQVSSLPDQDFGNEEGTTVFLLNKDKAITEGSWPWLRLDSMLFVFDLCSQQTGTVTIDEAYRVKAGPLKRSPFATWEQENGLTIPEPNIWERRRHLNGLELVNSYLTWKPFTFDDGNGTLIGGGPG